MRVLRLVRVTSVAGVRETVLVGCLYADGAYNLAPSARLGVQGEAGALNARSRKGKTEKTLITEDHKVHQLIHHTCHQSPLRRAFSLLRASLSRSSALCPLCLCGEIFWVFRILGQWMSYRWCEG